MPELSALISRPLLIGRLLAIAFAVLRHGLRFAGRLAVESWRRGPASPEALLGQSLAELCESLGATFIKLGQVLSSRPDLLPPDAIAPLRRLQQEVAPFDGRLVPAIVEQALGRPIREIFAHFDLEPVAAASVAQVHRARLPDGREVTVKIRRPKVVRRVRRDLLLLGGLASQAQRLAALRLVPLRELIDEVGRTIEQQLDFSLEAGNNRRLRDNFAGVEQVKIPELIEELCSGPVLTMEFLTDLARVGCSPALPRHDRETAALVGLRALYKMIFIDGFIHADLHPGNFFLRRWGEVVLLDFGLVAELKGADLRYFIDFFFGMVTGDGQECARVIRETASFLSASFDPRVFEAEMVRLIDHHANLKTDEFEVSRFAFQLFDLQRRLGVRGATAFTMTILSLVVYEGIVKQLHPKLDFQREARGYLIAAKYRHRPRAT